MFRKSKFSILALVVFSLALADTSDGFQDEPTEKERDEIRRFDEADINNNGTISREEFKIYLNSKLPGFPHCERLLKELDADGDDILSREEFGNRREVAVRMQDEPPEFADQFNEQFMDRNPRLGKQIENLVAFDENGKALSFESLKGKHTVIIFGCLT